MSHGHSVQIRKTNPKPNLSPAQASELLLKLYKMTVSAVRPLPSYDDQNFFVGDAEGGDYVLKVMNSGESKNLAVLEVHTHTMTFLHQNGLPAPTVRPTATGEVMSLQEIDCGFGPQKYMIRLLTHLPGITIAKVPFTPELMYEVGKTAAKMDQVLEKMQHPHLGVLQREDFKWSLTNFHMVETYLSVLDGDPMQEIVKSVIAEYKTSVVPARSSFRKCIIHGDFNDLNILVQPNEDDGYKVSGIIDFGDMSSGYYIYELAITIMYMTIEHSQPMEAGGPVLAGWESVFPLNEAERDALYLLVLARLCQSLVYARHGVLLQPENEEYLMMTSRKGVHILHRLWQMGKKQVETAWFQSAAQHSRMK